MQIHKHRSLSDLEIDTTVAPMLEEDAKVVEIRGDSVVVETSRQAACGGCGARTGCGTGVLSELFKAKNTRFIVKSALDLEVGNEVVIGVSESGILRGAFLVYILPLLGMFLCAMLIDVVLAPASEAIKLVAGAVGFLSILGWVRARHTRATGDPRFQPVIMRRKFPIRPITSAKSP